MKIITYLITFDFNKRMCCLFLQGITEINYWIENSIKIWSIRRFLSVLDLMLFFGLSNTQVFIMYYLNCIKILKNIYR